MADRGQIELRGVFGLAALVAAGWLFNEGVSDFGSTNGANVVAVVAVALVTIVCWVLLRKWRATRGRRRIQQSLLRKVHAFTQSHLLALARKRMRLVQPDACGNQNLAKWTEEIRYFLFDQLGPTLPLEERRLLRKNFTALMLTIDNAVQTATRDHPSTFSDDMSPAKVAVRQEPLFDDTVVARSPNFDRARWDALLKHDPQIRLIADRFRVLGQEWADKFALSYLATNDRSYLPILVRKIVADARREIELGKLRVGTDRYSD
jgi:hypothetical protein